MFKKNYCAKIVFIVYYPLFIQSMIEKHYYIDCFFTSSNALSLGNKLTNDIVMLEQTHSVFFFDKIG